MKDKLRKLFNLFKNWDETSEHIKWMLKTAKPFKWAILIMMGISIFSLCMSFASTIIGKYVVDSAIMSEMLMQRVILMASTTLFSIVFSSFVKIFSDYINEKFSFSMRCDIYNNIQRSIWQELTKYHSGDLVTRLTSDVSTVSSNLISFFPSTMVTILQLIIAFFILFYYDKPLALFALILAPFGAAAAILFKNKYQKYQTALRESESKYRSFMQESLSNITVIKTFQCEDESAQKLQGLKAERLSLIMSSSRLSAVMNAIMRLIYSLGYVVAFCWGAYRLSTGEITYGTMTIFITLVSQVQGSVNSLAHVIPQFYSMLISTKRIREVEGIEDEVYDEKSSVPQNVGLQMQDVSFTYDSDFTLKNVSLSINPGERVAIVGSSGAGKTTMIRLLLSLVKPNSGRVDYVLNGGETENAAPSSRRFISYVPQGNTLLSGTIGENLLTGNRNATDAQINEALETACAAQFVQKLPKGIDTPLSEHAGGLSEGQAQRIAIARALIRNKPVLILDEATSALDEDTESYVLKRITETTDKTCFIITHRSSMVKYCNKIVRIDDNGTVSISENTEIAENSKSVNNIS